MVVQLEEHGDRWYNNYSLIPFGMLINRYSYDNLSGGYFEKAAQSAHLNIMVLLLQMQKKMMKKKLH